MVFGDPIVELADAVLDVGHGGVGFAATVAAVGAGIGEQINCFADGGEVPDGAGGANEKLGIFVGVRVAETVEETLDAVGKRGGAGERGGERGRVLGWRSEHFFCRRRRYSLQKVSSF